MEPGFMYYFFIGAGSFLLLLVVPMLHRVVVGPTAIDRIVGINAIGTKTAVLLVIIGQIFGDVGMFVDFSLAYALLNFIGSVAASKYFEKHRLKKSPQNPSSEEGGYQIS